MNAKELLKKMLPGLVPLLIFILADEIWGTKAGLIVAIAVGVAEFVFIRIRTKKNDGFILLDTALLILMGVVSIILDNEIFFKIKPAVIETILAVILGISVFSSRNLLLKMSSRYIKGIEFTDFQANMFKKSLKVFFFMTLIHIVLVIISAFYMNNEAWVFVSGPLFYIFFALYFGFLFLKNKLDTQKYKKEEWLPLVDEKGNLIGKAPRSLCHKGKGMLHPVVHLHVFNNKNEFFLQKRPLNKKVQPGKWDTAVGGHISYGDSLEEGLKRETFEELGINTFNAQLLETYKWETEIESELIYMFVTKYQGKIEINKSELDDGKFWPMKDIEENLGKGIFTPNFEYEFMKLKEHLFHPH